MDFSLHRQASGGYGVFYRTFTLAKRIVCGITSQLANKRFIYAFITAAVLSSKAVHIEAHRTAIPQEQLRQWSFSFFGQDMLLLIIFRFLLDGWLFSGSKNIFRSIAAFFASIIIGYVTILSVVCVSFFAATGAEVHWQNIGFAGDASSRALLLSGIIFVIATFLALLLVAWLTQNVVYVVAGVAIEILDAPRRLLLRSLGKAPIQDQELGKYSEIPQEEGKMGFAVKETESRKQSFLVAFRLDTKPWGWIIWRITNIAVCIAMLAQIGLLCVRPVDSSLTFMSWTSAYLPFIDLQNSSPSLGSSPKLDKLVPVYDETVSRDWDSRTAIGDPIPMPWLPESEEPLMGFEDWYGKGGQHYQASADPLRISNLGEGLLSQLPDHGLGDVPIRHIVVLLLESTRKDVFPFKKDSLMYKKFAETWDNKRLPADAYKRVSTLNPIANYLTGDYNDGFNHTEMPRRGGINFNDAYTTASYTLKSITGTLCGIAPLVADFNVEFEHNIYQPCLPQIMDALNLLDKENNTDDFTTHKWSSSFMQSVTLDYDKFDRLIPALGFPEENIIDKEYLKNPDAKFGQVNLPDINYFGMEETPLESYIRDKFIKAKRDNERVFLTHITSTSHHPFKMPDRETYIPLAKNGHEDMSHYVNTIGFDDKWLGKVLNVLDEQGVANETLVVVLGDHGLPLLETGKPTCYFSPQRGCNQVPMVFSHPKLPAFDVNDPVNSIQVLPTILDLLLETNSLSEKSRKAVLNLITNYEGQSMIRSLHKNGPGGHPGWQFTVNNPGRAMVVVRDSQQKSWRLTVPVIDNVEFRFSALETDPDEQNSILGFDFAAFVKKVEEKHGIDAAKWAEEGTFAARWWVEENNKRWKYGPYKEKKEDEEQKDE